MTAAAFVAHARSLKGAKWRHRGRKPWALDCVGLVVVSARAAGAYVSDEKGYGREPWDDRLRKRLTVLCGDPIYRCGGDFEVCRPGDIALISWTPREPTHLAILGDDRFGLTLIHCETLKGCTEHPIDDHFRSMIVEVYRLWPVKSSL